MESRITDNAGMFSSKTVEWETPQDLFDQLDRDFRFTLDAAATPENAKCERFYTKEDDALIQEWTGTVWCNPPYGRQIGAFVEKGYNAAAEGEADDVVMLLPARTDTRWWHEHVMHSHSIGFVRGRLKFGGGHNCAPFPSAIVHFSNERFEEDQIEGGYPYVYTLNALGQRKSPLKAPR